MLETKNTRIAAEKLSISQPAVSKSLSRLRDYFGDELFTRVYAGLEPTPRALELGENIPSLLLELDGAVSGQQSFEPKEYDGRITVAMNGFIVNWLGSALSERIIREAPKAQLNIVNWQSNTLDKILTGDIQCAVNYSPLETSKQFVQKVIGGDDFVGLVRNSHPLAGKVMTMEDANTSKFVSLVVPGWNESVAMVARYFEGKGMKPNIQVRSTYLHMLLDLLKAHDLILPCSNNLAVALQNEFSPVYFPMTTPAELKDVIAISSHNKRRHPVQLWVNNMVSDTFRILTEKSR
ncbi:LysR family transcriptional regulator [Vibrio superstes NBRC 103154]|uniref:LysR family transcriptional regulator n=1 Tax=Vibrio superstes NBRC 103154 TaxID=1219062 RepID=A0A511QSJ5_9VIBR|nr:LysR family transcriptional regulator [Vibrio superstes NBRC 103154]